MWPDWTIFCYLGDLVNTLAITFGKSSLKLNKILGIFWNGTTFLPLWLKLGRFLPKQPGQTDQGYFSFTNLNFTSGLRAAVIAKWMSMRQHYSSPGFESHAHQCFFDFYSWNLSYNCFSIVNNTKITKIRLGLAYEMFCRDQNVL